MHGREKQWSPLLKKDSPGHIDASQILVSYIWTTQIQVVPTDMSEKLCPTFQGLEYSSERCINISSEVPVDIRKA